MTAFENLLDAYRKARRGKRCREDVATFDFDLEGNLRLAKDLHALASGSYVHASKREVGEVLGVAA